MTPRRPQSPPSAIRDGQVAGAMFGNFTAAQYRKAPPWAGPVLAAAAVLHIVIFVAMWAKTIWDLEQLEKPKVSIDLAVAPPPPPPPPPPPGGAKPRDVQITPKKLKVKELVQPTKVDKPVAATPEESGDPAGEEGGEEGGVAGGVAGGVVGAPPPPPAPPPAPQNVPPTMLEGSRIAGDKLIAPDDVTKVEIQRSGKDRIVGSFKLCLTVDGTIDKVSVIKPTGFQAYDTKITNKIRSDWRYRPYVVNGKAVPVCTAVTFIYSQR